MRKVMYDESSTNLEKENDMFIEATKGKKITYRSSIGIVSYVIPERLEGHVIIGPVYSLDGTRAEGFDGLYEASGGWEYYEE